MNPTWSIIIPVKPGGAVRALEALRNLAYPREHLEVIVSEGCRPSRQRNMAVAEATGEFVYFLDDDSLVHPDLLHLAESSYADARVAAVGGPSLTPPDDTLLQQAFGATLGSLIGGGSVRNRYRLTGSPRVTKENELILCNLSFRRELFVAFGGLDERLYPNEENELMDRIVREGWLLIHDPGLAVSRSQRTGIRDFVRQIFTYGRGRGEQTRLSRRFNLISLIPSLFILYLLLVPVVDNPVYTLPLLCYAGAVVVTAVREAFHRKISGLIPLLFLTVPALHLGYGAGLFQGLIAPRYGRKGDFPPEVKLRRVEI